LQDSQIAHRFLDATKFELQDRSAEREFGFVLRDTQRIWREAEHGVFNGLSFHITKHTRPSPADLKELIQAGGGKVVTASSARSLSPDQCFIISCKEDENEPEFRSLIANGFVVRNVELILRAVLHHRFDSNDKATHLDASPPTRRKK